MKIRCLTKDDRASVLSLEEEVWAPRGIECVPPHALDSWLKEGVLHGCFEGTRLVAYTYCERINFSPIPPYSAEITSVIESYHTSRSQPAGNALHGVSIASAKRGAGSLLLDSLLGYAQEQRLEYFVSFSRLSGLGRFVAENEKALAGYDELTVATLYAIQAVGWVSPSLIGPPLQLLETPRNFPRLRRKDPVTSRFAQLGKELWGVGKASFEDPESLGYSALLVAAA